MIAFVCVSRRCFPGSNRWTSRQGCPASFGWSHSVSKDLVHWEDQGRGVHMIHETYEGMDSTSCGPCSGFVTVDDKGTPCAGFRQPRRVWPRRDE